MKKLIYLLILSTGILTACHNQSWDFPDYDYTTVYFPYQYPVRTLVLGEDIYDNTLDNAHKSKIMATMGGVYENTKDRTLKVEVDNSLCLDAHFDSIYGKPVIAMPSEYYSLAADKQIVIPAGSISGGIEVQFTDAFFADSKSVSNTYVIPLKITSVDGIDSILSGKAAVENPDLRVADDWAIAPKNFILYGVKYINPWHGAYLRRGKDDCKGSNGNSALDTVIVYRKQYVERDQVVKMKTVSMNEVSLTLDTRVRGSEKNIPFEIRISVDGQGNCTVAQPNDSSYVATGNGKFVNDGDKWGEKPRDVMYLNYSVDFGTSVHTFTDTLVVRDRDVKFENFSMVIK